MTSKTMDQNRLLEDRTDIYNTYPRFIQEHNKSCVFASVAAAVSYLTEDETFTEQFLKMECNRRGIDNGPKVGETAHDLKKTVLNYKYNTQGDSPLTRQTVRKWVEQDEKIVILSRPLWFPGVVNVEAHMLTLFAWKNDHFVAWDTTTPCGKMAAVYEEEIEKDIPYKKGQRLKLHPDHDALIYWKR